MPAIIDRRATARIDGDFVVFLIGMRINKLWKPQKWAPMLLAMPRMLKELETAPQEVGFLGYTSLGLTTLVQYWRSIDHLEAYARARDKQHWPAWVEFNRRMKDARGDVGMPLFGLAKAGASSAIEAGGESARDRLGAR